MKTAKTIEIIGFIMLVVAFVLWLCNDNGYFVSLENTVEYIGLIGMILWSLAYAQRPAKPKKELKIK